MALTIEEKRDNIIVNLKDEVAKIKEKISSGELSGKAVEELKQNADILQAKINKFLASRNIISDQEVIDAYEAMAASARKRLEDSFKSDKRKNIILVAGIVLTISALYYLKYHK